MKKFLLTCKKHPDLRWLTKSIAWTPGYGYNGSRNIFFDGRYVLNPETGKYDRMGYEDNVHECLCPSTNLILAPDEDGIDDDL